MFPSAPPPKHHVQFALKLSVRFTPPAPHLPPPEIAKSDLPSNRQVRFTLKSSVRFIPPRLPPRNCQVWFTFKSPSPIYPQIICTIYPPQICQVRFTFKSPSPIYPQIVCMIYPPKIAKSDLPSNCLYDLPPQKLPSLIYPQIIFGNLPPSPLNPPWNQQVRFTLKSPTAIYPQIVCTISSNISHLSIKNEP